ncbi:porin [Pusillimonas sp.]|uniref:porin n=1 Tax=Pusillimonas sp. TaxID=3040095 RepID=UPI0037C64D4A
MKKSLLITALLTGFAGAAQANTSITLYGLLDGGVGYTKFRSDSVSASKAGSWDGAQSSNRWGLRGSEDLGDGLKAIFTLESGYSLMDGTQAQGGRLYGRQAVVGLKSNAWGTFTLGRQGNVAYRWLADVATPFGNNFNQARTAGTFSVAEVRYDNQVQYLSPSISGFQAGFGYSFNTDGAQEFKQRDQNEPNVRAVTVGLRYSNGPLATVLTYDQIKDAKTATGISAKSWNLAGSYDFRVAEVHLGFGITDDGWFGTPSQLRNSQLDFNSIRPYNDGFRAYSYGVGLSAPVGTNGKLLAGWGMVDPRKSGAAYAGRDLKAQHIVGLAYTYKLSARTNLYAQGAYGKNVAFVSGNKTQSIGVGLRHRF